MKLSMLRTNRGERGQAILEFALILPIFLIVLFLAVDFGVGFSRWIVITNATREAARYATVHEGSAASLTPEIKQRAVDASNGLLEPGDVIVNYIDADGSGAPGDKGDSVIVSASKEYFLITPIGAFLNIAFDTITISSCTDMRQERGVLGAVDDGVTQC